MSSCKTPFLAHLAYQPKSLVDINRVDGCRDHQHSGLKLLRNNLLHTSESVCTKNTVAPPNINVIPCGPYRNKKWQQVKSMCFVVLIKLRFLPCYKVFILLNLCQKIQ